MMLADLDLDAAKEERRQQARVNAAFLLCAVIGLLCYLPFDYWLIEPHWQLFWAGRLGSIGLIVACLLWQHGHPERSEMAVLISALGAGLFLAWGAAWIDETEIFFFWNVSTALALFVLVPVATVWHWRKMVLLNGFVATAYLLCFLLWSPFSFFTLGQYGGIFLLVGLLISPLLSQVRYFNFTRAATLRMELAKRNAELSITYDRLAQQHQELMQLANFDTMTGLPNRRRGMAFLKGSLANCQQEMRSPLSLMLIDVDHLKPVNDSLGHAAGDQLICAVARALESIIDKGEMACRMGGDEFLVVLPGASQRVCRARAEALCLALAEQRLAADPERTISASIGTLTYAPWNDARVDMDTLIQRVDSEMYHNKRRVRGARREAAKREAAPKGASGAASEYPEGDDWPSLDDF